jgi:hypothetical protein
MFYLRAFPQIPTPWPYITTLLYGKICLDLRNKSFPEDLSPLGVFILALDSNPIFSFYSSKD